MAKLIVFLFIIWYLEIGAQQPQVVQRTFATTQFDLDPNLPSEEFRPVIPTVFQSVISPQQQLPLEELAASATMIRSPSLPANVQPQPQQFLPSTSVAPRAKPYRTLAGDAARLGQTPPPTAGLISRKSQGVPPTSGGLQLTKDPSTEGIRSPVLEPNPPLAVVQTAPALVTQVRSPIQQPQNKAVLSGNQNPSSAFVTNAPNPFAAPSVALGSNAIGSPVPVQRRISSASLWFNETSPSTDCSRDYRQVSAEFKRKFPVKTAKDVRDKRLAEVVEQRLTDCDQKSKKDHWMHLMRELPKVKLSPSEEEECLNGLVQERIACVNLMSFTCQFIKREYSFRLVPARVIMQEARLAEDGAEKCNKVVRFIKKHDQPKKI